MAIAGLNHAVLYVRDATASAAFYGDVLGFTVVEADRSGRAVFVRAPASTNHHDLGLFTVGPGAGPATVGRSVGLYHMAWEVERIEDLAALSDKLSAAGVLVGASDHGVSKSLYAKDVDGIEFEVMWRVPPDLWGDAEHRGVVQSLDLARELERFGST